MAASGAKLLPHWRLIGDTLFTTVRECHCMQKFHSFVGIVVLSSAVFVSANCSVAAQEALVESAREASNSAKLKANESKDKPQWVKASIEIKAPKEVVWQAVHDERK